MAVRIKGTRFVYFPVPKCGSTSLKTAILHYNEPETFSGRKATEDEAHNLPGYGSGRWEREWKKWLRRPFIRPFCIIRDPVDRFVSAYRNIIVHEGRGIEGGINDFALNLAEHCASDERIRYHFAPMVEFLGKRPAFYERVFRISELGEVPDYVGIALSLGRERSEGPPMSRADLSKQAVAHLREFYTDDYAAWGDQLY